MRRFNGSMALLCAVAFVEASSAADRVFINGKIVTVDAAQTVASAMIVSDERILYVGDEEGARALAQVGCLV